MACWQSSGVVCIIVGWHAVRMEKFHSVGADEINQTRKLIKLPMNRHRLIIYFYITLKKVECHAVRQRLTPISPKTSAPQRQPIE